eukprot:COSAG05_NODE_469_length_9505_cov_14.573676_3_plen_47_part_00
MPPYSMSLDEPSNYFGASGSDDEREAVDEDEVILEKLKTEKCYLSL